MIIKMIAVGICALMILMSSDQLVRHLKYRKESHRWQWHATRSENRSSDIFWLHDRFWMIARLLGSLVLAVAIAFWINR